MAESALGPAHPIATLPAALENRQVEITGFVQRAALPVAEVTETEQPVSDESYQQIDFEAEDIRCLDMTSVADEGDGASGTCPFPGGRLGVRVGIYRLAQQADLEGAAPREILYGQRLRVRGRIRTPQTYGDPGVFDRRAYLLDHGISAVLGAKADDVETLSGAGGTHFGLWRARARRSLLQHVLALHASDGRWSLLSISQTDAALLAAMILGERSLLDQDVKLDFQRTGAYHLLVISGMAVAILAFAAFRLARLARLPDPLATVISVIFVGLYVSVTDLGAPVQRAALMCAIYMLARLLYRERNSLNAIGAAALVAMVADPKALSDAGFQMTFLAVLSIAGVAIPILERSTGVYRRALYQLDSTGFDLHLAPKQAQFRLGLRMILSRLERLLPRFVVRLLVVGGIHFTLRACDVIFISAVMQAALALPMAVYFHRATTLALPTNVLVVPIMSFLLPVALATTLLTYLGSWIAFLPGCMTAFLLHFIGRSIFVFSHFRTAEFRVPDPPVWAAVFCMMALALCIVLSRRPRMTIVGSLALLAIGDLAIVRFRTADVSAGKLEITAIDVGQGDALLVVTPQGKTVLIDGGGTLGTNASGFDVGEDVVSPYLWARGFSHLDAVALTHAHGDHIGGLPSVLRNFHPSELWIAPSPATAPFLALIAQANAAKMTLIRRSAGDKFTFGGATFDVFAPPTDADTGIKRGNDDSMVLKITFESTSALLEGDAEKKTERSIAPQLGQVNLLKVAHHGSNTSSITPFLDAVRPQFAIISAGKFNRYGHPRREVLQRLSTIGACTYRTDFNGALSFYLDGASVTSMRWGRENTAMEFPLRWIPPGQEGHCVALR